MGHFVSYPREREERGRRDTVVEENDERQGIGKKEGKERK